MTTPHIEKAARLLAERQIRIARRLDTDREMLEKKLPAAVDYAWPQFVEEATLVWNLAMKEAAKVADAADTHVDILGQARGIARRIRALAVEG